MERKRAALIGCWVAFLGGLTLAMVLNGMILGAKMGF